MAQLCTKNGFASASNQKWAVLITNSQTYMMNSLLAIQRGETDFVSSTAQLFYDANRATPRNEKVVLRQTQFSGGRTGHAVVQWPSEEFLKQQKRTVLDKVYVTKLEWGIGREYIESMRFTMSNGEVSPKFGVKAITDFCFFDSPIRKVTMHTVDRRLVGLDFYTEKDGLYMQVRAPYEPTSQAEHCLIQYETLLGFNMRVADKSLHGMSLNIASSNEIISSLQQ